MAAMCGLTTWTFMMLLVVMTALYAGVASSSDDDGDYYKMAVYDFMRDTDHAEHLRIERSPQNSRTRRPNTNTGGGRATPRPRRPRPNRTRRPDGDRRRPRPETGNDGLPAGVTRQMMRLAENIHRASTPFAARLFKALSRQPPVNTIISPFSIHTALTMTLLGARGRTQRELYGVLGHQAAGLQNLRPHEAYKALITSLQNIHAEVKIYSANAVFVKPNIPLENAFRQGLTHNYNASFDSFQLTHPQGPEAPINSWVANATRNKIQNLLTPGTVTPLTAVILVNTIYFNASWATPFDTSVTQDDQFQTLSGASQTVRMMSGEKHLGYGEYQGTQVIELPYKGHRLAMYVLLPSQNSSLAQLLQDLLAPERRGARALEPYLENLTSESIKLYMPKFKIEGESLDLKPALQQLGINRAFVPGQAEFAGISSAGELYIQSVIHKGVIEVNEAGTEAAASTVVIMGLRAILIPPREVKVNRPFAFLIRDKILKEVLFMGTYVGDSA